LKRGLAIAVVQALLASAVGAKFLHDRATYPRAWVEAVRYNPNAPLRGRYLWLQALAKSGLESTGGQPVRLEVRAHELIVVPVPHDAESRVLAATFSDGRVSLWPALPFLLPEHADDPTRSGEPLWMEVTVPPEGAPRPLRLGVVRDGEIEPLAID
jgi:hypothetical protein